MHNHQERLPFLSHAYHSDADRLAATALSSSSCISQICALQMEKYAKSKEHRLSGRRSAQMLSDYSLVCESWPFGARRTLTLIQTACHLDS